MLEGKGVREVSRLIGVSPSSVSRWKQQLKQGGLDALCAKPHPGRSPKLTAEQKKELEGILLKGARAAGFPTDLWTLKRVAQVIAREFGVTYHPGYVWTSSRVWDGVPRSQSDRRGSETKRRRLAHGGIGRVKKKSRDHGWYIMLIDESGYMLQPLVHRTWAPRGETPILYS